MWINLLAIILMSSNSSSQNPIQRERASAVFNPNTPNIIQPYKSLYLTGLFDIQVNFTNMMISTVAIVAGPAHVLDPTMVVGEKISLQDALDFSKRHGKISDKTKKTNPSQPKVDAIPSPKRSLDRRDFELPQKEFEQRVNSVVGQIPVGSYRTKFYERLPETMNSPDKFARNKTNSGIEILTVSEVWKTWVSKESSMDLIYLLMDKSHFTKYSENPLNPSKILAIKTFPASNDSNPIVFNRQSKVEEDAIKRGPHKESPV